jgi:hypothetical protein
VTKKSGKSQWLEMAGIPVNRPHVYEKSFFKESASVLQGILFPLKRKTYKAGKIKLGKAGRKFGASGRGLDTRSISYPETDE